jgi:apolipoprotein D and lipocalin family protein
MNETVQAAKHGLKKARHGLSLLALLVCGGCSTGVPQGVVPVSGFEVARYLGTWYEIARLDHSFERGLSHVTAEYSQEDGGRIRVLNRGYDAAHGRWKQVTGRAYFIGAQDEGRLKVSFFRPFYGAYNIIDLDQDAYEHAMVCGPDRSYLWILARTPHLDAAVYERLVAQAKALKFPVDGLIVVSHDPLPEPGAAPAQGGP